MPNENEVDAKKLSSKADRDNIATIEAVQHNEHAPRGNVHSEEEPATNQDAPPPLPN